MKTEKKRKNIFGFVFFLVASSLVFVVLTQVKESVSSSSGGCTCSTGINCNVQTDNCPNGFWPQCTGYYMLGGSFMCTGCVCMGGIPPSQSCTSSSNCRPQQCVWIKKVGNTESVLFNGEISDKGYKAVYKEECIGSSQKYCQSYLNNISQCNPICSGVTVYSYYDCDSLNCNFED